ncbi:GntR family transcriptional regulator [Nocardia grenadensis]|uniref:GntR family transcriptional regulator n=1 Tax=Nocardia grenadensis TaxID=931537 RepID=UPI003D729819
MTNPKLPTPRTDNGHAVDIAYGLIRDQILSGQRRGGEWLREGEIAEALGLSRTPVREAFRRLTAERLVRYERNRGVQVQGWSVRDLDEIFSLRTNLEPFGCRLAAAAGAIDLAELAGLADEMDAVAAAATPDLDTLTMLNNRFHRMVLIGSGNSRLPDVVASVVQMPLVWRTFAHYSPEALRRSLAHHHEIVDALAAADPDWAESVMRSHIRAAWSDIRSRMDDETRD